MQVKKIVTTHWLFILFTIAYFAYALSTYKDLPIANGEEFRYLRGKETLEHLIHGTFTEKLIQPRPHYFLYNVYTTVLVALNPNFYYEWFHLFNLSFAYFIFLLVYCLVFFATFSTWLGAFSVLSLALFPTFSGQLGFNPIDMPFTVFYMFSLLLIYLFVRKDKNLTITQLLILGCVFGVTQGLRQLGFTLYLVIAVYTVYISGFNLKHQLRLIPTYLLLFIVANFFMLITWPNFAVNYFKNMYWYLFIGQKFYLWDYGLLYMGNFLTNAQRPAMYLPLLQIITSPVYLLTLFISGVFFIKKLIRHHVYFLVAFAFTINYGLYFLLKPVVYDGTRHFMFLVPMAIVLSMLNFKELYLYFQSRMFRLLIFILIGINFLFVLSFIIRAYPYHYVYFNRLGYIFGNPNYVFEADYSSTLYRRSAEWIRDEYVSTDLLLKVYVCDNGYAVDYFSHKKFLTTIYREEADLIVCDYKTLLRNSYIGEVIHTDFLNDVPFILVLKTDYQTK